MTDDLKALNDSIHKMQRDLSREIKEVRTEFIEKLEKMDVREIERVKDLYQHIDDKFDKMVSKELFDTHVRTTDQRINFIWRVFFWAVGPIFAGMVGLAFTVFTK